MSDLDLINRVLDGDTESFGLLIQQYQKLIYRLAFRYVGNHEDADDLVQSIFLTAYEQLSRFRGESTFKTWLYRIGMNHCLNFLAKKKRHEAAELETLPELANPGPLPLDELTKRWQEKIIAERILDLPDRQRQVVLLRAVEGFSYREIADILGCPIATAKTNYHYGVRSLRRMILGDDDE